ncbi:NAD-dependent succinate-semialdehyde dehydrogenase [Polyangium sp. y55x31]|uniref:NAD-dependent succinate-semialdehyde dehydrogenase n=1 Tax=Polyangium sp. y55x31 TaxID=3042688 RepID=UPI002482F184|nr:NAD-dependent succinate-semialdehyde dehydrogenase [Polyangium sp. y55x31]MDI1481303.1 NAD-dependent succinate-semialdehyde dehydrogenase [Polyangium sp. y55x31]
MAIATINPATGELLDTFEALSESALGDKLALAAQAFRRHRRIPIAERARCMRRAAEILEAEKVEHGRTMTLEMGKPIRAGIAEATKCALACRYYAENAERFLADEVVPTEAERSFIVYQPLGPVLAIMPWNFPYWQVFRFLAPALMAGNVGLLKHAHNVPRCALAIESIVRRAGFDEGVFQTLLLETPQVAAVIEDPRVAAVTLTGSEGAGSKVASTSGKEIKKTVMELGGSDPFIVMPSADLEAAAKTAVRARTINTGQSCIAAKRFIVHEAIADAFERRFVAEMSRLVIGDPMDEATEIGPLATKDVLGTLVDQVERSVAAGARVLLGGKRLDRPGYYYEPTVLTDVPREAPAHHEELFGPVATLFRVRDLDEAIAVANDTRFGLGSSAWTRDPAESARFVDELEAGAVFLNAMVASDPRLPFGGVKRSGYGRELGVFGLREFVNVKTVWAEDVAAPSVAETE